MGCKSGGTIHVASQAPLTFPPRSVRSRALHPTQVPLQNRNLHKVIHSTALLQGCSQLVLGGKGPDIGRSHGPVQFPLSNLPPSCRRALHLGSANSQALWRRSSFKGACTNSPLARGPRQQRSPALHRRGKATAWRAAWSTPLPTCAARDVEIRGW